MVPRAPTTTQNRHLSARAQRDAPVLAPRSLTLWEDNYCVYGAWPVETARAVRRVTTWAATRWRA